MRHSISNKMGSSLTELLFVVTVLSYLLLVVDALIHKTASRFAEVVGWQ